MNAIVVLLGVVLLLAGVGALYYTTTETQTGLFGFFTFTKTTKPLEPLGYPLIVGGIVLLIVGATLANASNKQ